MTDSDVWQRAVGKLEGEVQGLQVGQAALQRDVSSLRAEMNVGFIKVYEKLDDARDELSQNRGGIRAAYVLIGAIGAVLGAVLPYLFHLPR